VIAGLSAAAVVGALSSSAGVGDADAVAAAWRGKRRKVGV